VKEIAAKAGAPYFVERWIGGFLTNWDAIKKNLDKAVRMDADRESGAWKKYVKHEQTQMTRILEKLQVYYSGVLKLKKPPQALFVIDVKKENAAIREALRIGIPIIGVVDTNSNPININYVIPANDDAVGSITLISQYIADAYAEGLKMRQDNQETPVASRTEKPVAVVLPAGKTEKLIPENKNEKVTLSVSAVTKDTGKTNQKKTEVKNPAGEISVAVKKRGRPKKNL
jgi:small subunit ribosomal protein S2